jgi:Flp pilus assembly protein TadB
LHRNVLCEERRDGLLGLLGGGREGDALIVGVAVAVSQYAVVFVMFVAVVTVFSVGVIEVLMFLVVVVVVMVVGSRRRRLLAHCEFRRDRHG